MFNNPTIDNFKTYFFRDFPYQPDGSPDLTKYIQDQDIANAFVQTTASINQENFADQSTYQLGFELLSAHYLVMNIRQSSQGIAGSFEWGASSKSVGSVSESLAIPQRLLDNPELAYLTKTNYGTQYLMIVLPYLSGQVFCVAGTTWP